MGGLLRKFREERRFVAGRGEVCSKDYPDSGAVLVGMREGIPSRINKNQTGSGENKGEEVYVGP